MSRDMRFLVKIYHYKRCYSAMVPDLPGCIAAAGTSEECRRLIAEAMGLSPGSDACQR
jgi:predicted RNase H-like HicB family nuclease